MSDASQPGSEGTPVLPSSESGSPVEKTPERVLLVGHPKVVFLYPTFFAAIWAGIFTALFGEAHPSAEHMVTLAFLGILTINMAVLTFDFPRTTSLTLFFFLAFMGMATFLTFHFKPELLPIVGSMISALKPAANAHFYFLFAGVLLLLFIGVMIAVRFDYWEVRPNELLHHHGFLSDLKRFPAPNLRIDKEINDVFEHLLLGSGRLILHSRDESRAIVIENVLFINRKEQQLTQMLGSLQVSLKD